MKLRDHLKAATPGKWQYDENYRIVYSGTVEILNADCPSDIPIKERKANYMLIAHLQANAEALAELVEAARALVESGVVNYGIVKALDKLETL